jgi:putative hydrolase of the HAD superfamily
MNSALVFDLDDTLYPERMFVLGGFRAVDAWLSAQDAVNGFYDIAVRLFDEGCRGHVFDLALASLGVAHDAESIARLVSVYREHEPILTLHDDARWALERFRDTHRLGLLTDGYLATQRRKVRALGIESSFDVIVYSDAYGRECWKPSPVPYRAIMQRLGRPGDCCTYISDNATKDFTSPRELGWTTVQIRRADGEYRHAVGDLGCGAQFEIESLYELEGLVEAECW